MVLRRSVARFDMILTVSGWSKRAILSFCERHRVTAPPIRVTYESIRTPPERAGSGGNKRDVVVHLASVEPHKRTATLLRLWKQLTETRKDLPALQLIGNVSPSDRAFGETIPGFTVEGRLTSAELHDRLASARALLLPSEIEGFGLPALEAYAAGTPVVYVRGTAVEEILGETTAGGFVLDDFESFGAAVGHLLELPLEWVEEQARRLRSKYSWQYTADATIAAYRECLRLSA
jgi:glycosyltransferase involved in cell wall biosynthesis